ncbi:unnamed protein product [Brachionus calyciflorus]|uniref:Serine/threonine-protein kinase 1 n=1 Tax=Brachionus calyciflorus TaxID=104777 RepID=A0A814B7Q3_9BILA|nr:unnamed protein product [Brachionus calyciflorus]
MFNYNFKSNSLLKNSLEDRINSSSTHGSYADTYSSLAVQPSQKPTYKLIKSIGFGGYGRVYEGIRSDDGLPVIIKLIPKSGIVNWSTKQFSATHNPSSRSNSYLPFEIECLIRLRDTPGIIKIYDFFEETTCFVIVMEKLPKCMTLFDLANGKPFSFSQTILKRLFTQLIKINLAIFAKGIVHRDIKPENILVNLEDYSIKIIDFGSAANFRGKSEPFREFQGTLECMPPEWILSGFYESEPATSWSIGVTFYFAVFGRYPFRSKSHIISGKFPLPYSNVSNELLQFLDSCFQMNASKRFTLHQLLNSQWLKRHEKH